MGNVPHLRFPEFSGEWEEHTLSEYLEFKNGLNPDAKRIGSGLPFISVMDILSEGVINYDNIRGKVNATEKEIECFGVKDGDLLFQRSSETLEDVGRANVYMDNRTAIYGGFVIRGRKIGNYDPLFFKYLLATPLARKRTCRMGAGAQHFNIGQEGLSKISLYFPSIEEQRKIAEFLSLIDERIATQNKIIEDLKKLKSAISKQAFAQKPNGWNRLDTLFSKGKAGGTPTSTNKEYYNGEIPFLSINDITKQGKYVRYTENHLSRSGLENSSAWVVPEYSLIISMYASVGLVTINEVPITTSQAMFAMQLRDKDLLDYLYYYLSYFKYRHIHKYLETGTQSNINADIVRGIMIPTYGHSRNMKIASTLQGIDAKIDNELSVLKLFNRQKNYLLSQMFI
ncbi:MULTISPECIES: restriction endonuclease subunit S [Bacteroidales]|uniref:restriction endonuclease subunit S n=1 Tax=Bacteroidales TaxID=171549 RepID=UPI0005179BB0|nr:restriction endonuclease subunit S [Phocaeicola dorei]MBV3103937.1 restriction endonuclease subunit S [Bacteroides thetaiotaomicron]MCA6032428.1 restriction endonuclease subunit S [Bacteroides thetaiotaomicron]RJV58926.1 restriction endonuclease subunit S [Bacteroides sp. AF16-29]RJX06300.1 restriction endonuclease subunit S [Bacteroides sp. AF15-23LB]